ncbi:MULTISPECIES: hypothetical protein [Burkholderiaceae]|jgi:hypothetical protein|uniref:Uncharacterized protein n=1 Tax=Ralstonia pickettii TaxID=329 RepID=A0AAW4QCW6_RALPI|nr:MULTISPECIES: hypothetical protein [Burkholderiaceae]UCF21812.1 MAG: hypothetical protein JSV72_12405 [Ralstonia sp.]UNK04246.1 hypothetical protein MMB19_30295 [Ralstonia insidiosa]MBA9847879.1 hypothetical protein [Ralstonia pickettii]MBA9853437.1 hypothetical protein [Ralstonia pickettii]MBA9920932.1 hypothetical protein [Ralstonia pickettii]
MREPLSYLELHMHDDTCQVRAYMLGEGDEPLRFHAGFSQRDIDAGWKQVMATDARGLTAADIEQEKAKVIESHRRYWKELAERNEGRVVCNGIHYTMHELGKGIGFGGQAFLVRWLDADKSPTRCNLSYQGRVPAWMRGVLPDNAASIQDKGRH